MHSGEVYKGRIN